MRAKITIPKSNTKLEMCVSDIKPSELTDNLTVLTTIIEAIQTHNTQKDENGNYIVGIYGEHGYIVSGLSCKEWESDEENCNIQYRTIILSRKIINGNSIYTISKEIGDIIKKDKVFHKAFRVIKKRGDL